MDFLSLSSEYESYKDYFSIASSTMSSLANFFTNINKGLDEYIKLATNSLNELINSLLRYDHRSTHIKKFFEFSRLFERHLIKLSLLSKKISNELISPTINFDKFLLDENSYQLMLLQNMIVNTINQKKKYEEIKHKYFESCQLAEKQEKKLLEEMNRSGSTQQSVNSQNEILTQLRVNSQIECQQYKNEHKITNDLYDENNKKYFPLINILKDNEEKRINFLSFHLEKFIGVLKEEKGSLESLLNSLEEENLKIKSETLTINLNEDVKLYQEKFNFVYKPGLRFIKEEIVLYDIYRRNIEAIINNNKKFTGKLTSSEINLNNSMLEYNQRFLELDKNSERMALDQNDSLIYKHLFENNINVNHKLFSLFENKLRNDSKFASTILEKMFCEYFQSKIYYQFKTKDQFIRVAQVLMDISMNKDIINYEKPIFEINFTIIYIAERGFYLDEKNHKKYLCSTLGEKCDTFKEKDYWKNLLIFKINSSIKKLTNKEFKEDTEKEKSKTKSKVQGAVKYLIQIGKGSSSKHAASQKLKAIKEKKEKEVRYRALITILKEFVSHFPNFHLDMPICNDIIMEIGAQYYLEKVEIMYLISFINSNMYSIKSNNLKIRPKSKYLINKINDINNIKQKNLLLILNSCFMFLYPKEYIKLTNVNKFFYNNTRKTIYKHIFLKSDNSPLSIDLYDINKHINLWLCYLKYKKNTLVYEEQKKIISEKNLVSSFIDIINLDVDRTFFDTNQIENRAKLKNILVTLSICYPNIGYCQGMSYIGQFFLQLTKYDEERTFDVFSALLTKGNYSNLMVDNFEKMKKYFYVFERLINIYLPDLDIVLKKNNVTPSYYVTPWFITLFTHSFSVNHTKLLLRIFDTFFLDGWICIIRIGLLLLKYYQNYLIEMKFEEILQFLINELKEKYDFFNNSNYDKFIELYHEMKIPKGLVINIENEFELNKKVEKIKQNYLEANSTDLSSNDDEDIEENEMDF